jgi:hypothetical protein
MIFNECNLSEDTRGKIIRLKSLYEKNKINGFDINIYSETTETEKTVPGFIFDFYPLIKTENETNEEIRTLRNIISVSRKQLLAREKKDCRKDSLMQCCIIATGIVSRNLSDIKVEIWPFDFEGEFKQHRALLVKFQSGNHYLIDLTYQQFFLIGNNLKERYVRHSYGVIEGPYVGYRMIDGGFLNVAKGVIEDGFISVESDMFKPYMDGFIKAFYINDERDRYLRYSTGNYVDEIKRKRLIGHVGY